MVDLFDQVGNPLVDLAGLSFVIPGPSTNPHPVNTVGVQDDLYRCVVVPHTYCMGGKKAGNISRGLKKLGERFEKQLFLFW